MKHLPLIMVSLLVSACGGSGEDALGSSSGISFNGNLQAASITSENVEAIGKTAGESVQRAAQTGSLPSPITVVSSSFEEIIVATQTNNFSASALLDSCTTGSAESTSTTLDNGKVSQTIVYNRCKLSGSNNTANGRLTALYNNINNLDAGFTLTYTNFTLSASSTSDLRLNVTVACADRSTCTYNSDFKGSDNDVHRISAFNFTGNSSTGFNGSATFYHERHGRVSIASSGLTYGACDTRPSGGVIAFSSTNSSGTIDFDPDCTVSGTWTNSTGSGSF